MDFPSFSGKKGRDNYSVGSSRPRSSDPDFKALRFLRLFKKEDNT
jgi:hypothetical protein